MEYRRLGRTGLEVSLLSLGSGGFNQFGQTRHVADHKIIRLVHQALDAGINYFDTASCYRNSESLLGQAFRGIPRHQYVIASKVRPLKAGAIIQASDCRQQVEQSLVKLGVGELDILQIHATDPGNYHEIVDRLGPELDRLRSQGKIRYLGITESTRRDPHHVMLTQALNDDFFDTIMVAYHLGNTRAADSLFPLAQKKDVGVIGMIAARHLVNLTMTERFKLLGRILSGLRVKSPKGRRFGHILHSGRDAIKVRNTSGTVCRDNSKEKLSLPVSGYSFAASHPAVATVLTGTTNPDHLVLNVAATLAPALSDNEIERLLHLLK